MLKSPILISGVFSILSTLMLIFPLKAMILITTEDTKTSIPAKKECSYPTDANQLYQSGRGLKSRGLEGFKGKVNSETYIWIRQCIEFYYEVKRRGEMKKLHSFSEHERREMLQQLYDSFEIKKREARQQLFRN